MILAVDVAYRKGEARAAGVLFHTWDACETSRVAFARCAEVAAYVPGQFYKRELPPILALLEQFEEIPAYVLVDGYVYLGRKRRPGLGRHLYDALQGQAAVIGVAKSRFRGTPAATHVLRGNSRRPLYVTAVGVCEVQARRWIAGMCGAHRVPKMLRLADRLSKGREGAYED
ncbi:MAG: endonuclease V [Anaerolineae bacterium]